MYYKIVLHYYYSRISAIRIDWGTRRSHNWRKFAQESSQLLLVLFEFAILFTASCFATLEFALVNVCTIK